MRRLAALALVVASGCSTFAPKSSVVEQTTLNWRAVATQQDRSRLREWRTSFIEGLTKARSAGHSAEIAGEGVLLNPDAALGGGPIPNGMYRCRVIKLGAKSEGLLDYVSYPGFSCRIRPEQGVQGFAKISGSQRYVGLIYPGDELRQVFLGTLVLGDETRAAQYGVDRERDVAGYVERIGPNRWRLLMPEPAFESRTDILELIPVAGQ
ncbi:MAG: DUF4893 domain-containing protein [Sphingomicrobium sp.]